MDEHENNRHWLPPAALERSDSQVMRQELRYSGPLPMALELEKYEKICPGAAHRIIVMAEEQTKHRQGLEQVVVHSNVRNERLGMHYSFILTGALMVSGFMMILAGKDTAGYFAVFGPVVFHSGNYIVHKWKEQQVTKTDKDEIHE